MKPRFLFALVCLAAFPVSASSQAAPRLADLLSTNDIHTADELGALLQRMRHLPADQQRQLLDALRIDPRIVGGFPVQIANHPWQVALVRGLASDRLQFCGGALIAPDLVVTAAHCIDNNVVSNDANRVDVVAGTERYNTGGERIDVRAVYVHPQWNSSTHDYDIAILRLQARSVTGRPIPIDPGPVAVGARPMVTGWGSLSEGGQGSLDLMGVDVPIVDTSICNQQASYDGSITPRMFCAGEQEGGKDSCQGDSGGPISLGSGDAAKLVGVVSWGEGCARHLKYGVYTRISEVASWVQSFVVN